MKHEARQETLIYSRKILESPTGAEIMWTSRSKSLSKALDEVHILIRLWPDSLAQDRARRQAKVSV